MTTTIRGALTFDELERALEDLRNGPVPVFDSQRAKADAIEVARAFAAAGDQKAIEWLAWMGRGGR